LRYVINTAILHEAESKDSSKGGLKCFTAFLQRGGLHFPITDSPLRKPGLKVQMIWGTGKPPWKRITEKDLERTIENLNAINPKHVFLSAHDTCDYAIDRFQN